MNYITQALVFLIEIFFSFSILMVLLRFFLTFVRADFYNPVSQFVVKVTNPLIKPLRGLIRIYNRVDFVSIIVLILLQATKLFLILFIANGIFPSLFGLFLLTIAHLLGLIFNFYFFIIIILVIISWVNPSAYNPLLALIYQLSDPVLRVIKKIIPPIGVFDLAPLIVIISINMLKILLVSPLMDIGNKFIF